MSVDINDFEREADCVYKNERYTVRDNGAVFRHRRRGKSLRKYDNVWTFGKPNNYNYLLHVSEVVHRIVACAFLGEPPTSNHIVDHIDTNCHNNRPENLRWLTKLENILNNPATVKKIEFYCGSIEAFLKDPSILKDHIDKDPNFGWMRAVTPKEAQTSWTRIKRWSDTKRHNKTLRGGKLDEWIFQENVNDISFQEAQEFTTSLTSRAVQRDWKTPSEFPNCPQGVNDSTIEDYAENLKVGDVFARNKYSDSIIIDFALANNNQTLFVVCKNNNASAVKPWLLAQITYEDNLFIHANRGSYLEQVGAQKQFVLSQGLEWTGGDTVDDFI